MLQLLQATEEAAIACYEWIGRGDEKGADAAATHALRRVLNALPIRARVVIGEGERDNAPMLYIGERLGILWNNPSTFSATSTNISKDQTIIGVCADLDIAVDPLEGTTICASNGAGALSVMAVSEPGGLLNAPDVYMNKIAIGRNLPKDLVDLDATPYVNIMALAKAKHLNPQDLCVTILDRPRHKSLVAAVRSTGARIKLIQDGDVSAILEVCDPSSHVDLYCGIGGAPEGVLAAAAVTAMGGQMQGRLIFENTLQTERAKQLGISDLERKYSAEEMAPGKQIIFIATGITNGNLLRGVRQTPDRSVVTDSLLIHKAQQSVQYITNTKLQYLSNKYKINQHTT